MYSCFNPFSKNLPGAQKLNDDGWVEPVYIKGQILSPEKSVIWEFRMELERVVDERS